MPFDVEPAERLLVELWLFQRESECDHRHRSLLITPQLAMGGGELAEGIET
jgi:hypothetical protein